MKSPRNASTAPYVFVCAERGFGEVSSICILLEYECFSFAGHRDRWVYTHFFLSKPHVDKCQTFIIGRPPGLPLD